MTPRELDSQMKDEPSCEIGDRPHRGGEPGLLQPHAGAHGQRSGVETLHGVDRRDPLRPALEVHHHGPDSLGRGGDGDGALQSGHGLSVGPSSASGDQVSHHPFSQDSCDDLARGRRDAQLLAQQLPEALRCRIDGRSPDALTGGRSTCRGADECLDREDCGALGPVVGREVRCVNVDRVGGGVAVGVDLLLHGRAGGFGEPCAFPGDENALACGEVGDGGEEPAERAAAWSTTVFAAGCPWAARSRASL